MSHSANMTLRWMAYHQPLITDVQMEALLAGADALERQADLLARVKRLEDKLVPFVRLHPEMFPSTEELFDLGR